MATFTDILNKFRQESFSERDKGYRFERLMQAYLKTTALYANLFDEVWLWNDFPYHERFGGKDIGIDLVARTVDGEYWAIQCKCYAADAFINKPDVDTFLSTSGKLFERICSATVDIYHQQMELYGRADYPQSESAGIEAQSHRP